LVTEKLDKIYQKLVIRKLGCFLIGF